MGHTAWYVPKHAQKMCSDPVHDSRYAPISPVRTCIFLGVWLQHGAGPLWMAVDKSVDIVDNIWLRIAVEPIGILVNFRESLPHV